MAFADIALRDNGASAFDIALSAGGTSYTLTAALGTFTEAGSAALAKRTGLSSVGAFAESGNASFAKRSMLAVLGSFVEVGNASLARRSGLSSLGAFVLTGNAALAKRSMLSSLGAYALVGNAALAKRSGAAALGAFVLAGNAAFARRTALSDLGAYLLAPNTLTVLRVGPDVVVRPSSRKIPFSLGGAGDRTAGALLPDGPDPLYDIDLAAPDLRRLPMWDRRPYDAWTTLAFRSLVRAWLADMIDANSWMYRWRIRERATAPRLSALRLTEPLLIVTVQRRRDGREFETAISWTARERDDSALANAKLALARATLEALNLANP